MLLIYVINIILTVFFGEILTSYKLELVTARVSPRALMFQWNPSPGYYDGYALRWQSEEECTEQLQGEYFLTRSKAIQNEISDKRGYHFYKLDDLHPGTVHYLTGYT